MSDVTPAHVRVGIDVGGTFTDVVAVDDASGDWSVLKLPSTPTDPAEAVLAGLDGLLARDGQPTVGFLGHGTTVATNALLTGTAARTVLLTTAGFESVLEFRRMDRSGVIDPYDLQFDAVVPLVPAELRFGVRERVAADGSVVEALTDAELDRVIALLEAAGPEAVAVSLLWSFANPAHEVALRDAIRRWRPEVHVTCSHEVDPAMLEYERTSTTVMHAMLAPPMARYLGRFAAEAGAKQLPAPRIMQSSGGLAPVPEVCARPAVLVESGPAAGVAACTHLARSLGIDDAFAVDMGGTSFDVALILGGEPTTTVESDFKGHALRLPMLDIRSIGAGGGSIAWVDDGGALRVGPASAGSVPGPACYGRGGTRPTVTDANAVLGYIERLVGGSLVLDTDAARAAVDAEVAGPLGLDTLEAAAGVHRIVNALMAEAMRLMATERALRPADLTMIAYGGAGPLHAASLARELGIRRTVIPRHPGTVSALGVATADLVHDRVEPVLRPLDADEVAALEGRYRRMEADTGRLLDAEGFGPDERTYERSFVARYVGQMHDLEVRLPEPDVSALPAAKVIGYFHDRHREVYGFSVESEPVLVVSARVRAIGRTPKPHSEGPEAGSAPEPVRRRRAWFVETGGVDCPIYERPRQATLALEGPAVIEEYDSTTVVLPGQRWWVDRSGALVLEQVAP